MKRMPIHQAWASLLFAAAAVIASGSMSQPAAAQPGSMALPTVEDSIVMLQTTIARRTADRDQLQRMLAALNVVDSVYRHLYPAWLVIDDDLKERINRVFRNRRLGVAPDTDIVVIASPERRQILELAVGSVRLGRLETRQAISDSLQTELLDTVYQRRPVDLAEAPSRANDLQTRPRYASLTASAFGVTLMFTRGLGLEAAIGREEMGYHFWSSGDFSIRALLYGLKLGILLPFPYGFKREAMNDPLSIRPTFMAGSTGFSGEFEHPFGRSKVGLRLAVGELFLGSLLRKVPSGLSAYSLHSTAQTFFTQQVRWGDDEFAFTGGVGFHQVTRNEADGQQNRVHITEKTNFAGPVIRVDYTRIGERLYGGALQYYSGIFFVSGWVEIVRNFLFLDLKYYTPLGREAHPWEQRYFFMVSPRLQITY
jgi:hypothetical protein